MAPSIQIPATTIERQTHGAHDTTRFFTRVIGEINQANTLTTDKTLTDHVEILARDGLALRNRDLHALNQFIGIGLIGKHRRTQTSRQLTHILRKVTLAILFQLTKVFQRRDHRKELFRGKPSGLTFVKISTQGFLAILRKEVAAARTRIGNRSLQFVAHITDIALQCRGGSTRRAQQVLKRHDAFFRDRLIDFHNTYVEIHDSRKS